AAGGEAVAAEAARSLSPKASILPRSFRDLPTCNYTAFSSQPSDWKFQTFFIFPRLPMNWRPELRSHFRTYGKELAGRSPFWLYLILKSFFRHFFKNSGYEPRRAACLALFLLPRVGSSRRLVLGVVPRVALHFVLTQLITR